MRCNDIMNSRKVMLMSGIFFMNIILMGCGTYDDKYVAAINAVKKNPYTAENVIKDALKDSSYIDEKHKETLKILIEYNDLMKHLKHKIDNTNNTITSIDEKKQEYIKAINVMRVAINKRERIYDRTTILEQSPLTALGALPPSLERKKLEEQMSIYKKEYKRLNLKGEKAKPDDIKPIKIEVEHLIEELEKPTTTLKNKYSELEEIQDRWSNVYEKLRKMEMEMDYISMQRRRERMTIDDVIYEQEEKIAELESKVEDLESEIGRLK